METAEVESELEELENRIERLRALYEQYFMGIEKLEPQIPRKDVDRRIWVMRREQIRNTGLRFKFQMLVQRYNTFQQYWGRITREIENGTYRRDVVRAVARFGQKDALTIVGKKRAQQYEKLLEKQGLGKRPAEEPTEEELEARISQRGLSPDLLRKIQEMDESSAWEDERPAAERPAAAPQRPTVAEARPGAPPLKTGLRFGSAPRPPASLAAAPERAPSDAAPPPDRPSVAGVKAPQPDEAKRRVAALAAEMKAQRAASAAAPSAASGPLDLDLDLDSPASRKRRSTSPPRRKSSGKMKAVNIPPPAPVPVIEQEAPAAVKPPAPAPARPVAPAPSSSTESPAAPRPAAAAFRQAAQQPRPAPAKPAGPDDGLNEQRLRQIYAKYVETKRASNESTAGITYEKLADSLRAQAAKLRATHTTRKVDYDVVVKDGKTVLKPILK